MTTTIGTKPILTIDAIYSHIATDEDGKRYHHWAVNHDARQEPSVCEVCGKQIDSGWHCIDSNGSHCDSDLYCDDCIIDSEDAAKDNLTTTKRVLWLLMCGHDNVDPCSAFVAFSEDNPYSEVYDLVYGLIEGE